MIKFRFEGGQDIDRAFKDLANLSTRKSVARRVLLKAVQIFADRANALAPKGRTGELAKSYVVGGWTRLNGRSRRAARREGAYDVQVYAGTNDRAGAQQEFGNRRHRAQPHARPAWEQTQNQIFRAIQEGMIRELARSVQRARRRAERLARKTR